MVWSQFSSVVQCGVYFGNSVLDNSKWDKISHSLTKKSKHRRKVGYTSEFLFGIYWWTLKNPENQTWSWSYAILFLRYMVCDGCNCYFSMSAIFCSFTPLTALKKKIWKKRKKQQQQQEPEDIIILHKYTKNHDHMLCCSWDIWCVTDVIVIFHFGLFFALLPH